MKHTIAIAAATLAVATGAVTARAGCADFRTVKPGMTHTIPTFLLPRAHGGVTPAAAATPDSYASRKIVGTWVATYTVEGQPFAQAFIQWHDDGTEWENINVPIDGGNVCVGSWVSVDRKDVARNHIGWLYTNGQLDTADTYSGTNDQKIYDLNGNVLAEVTGTSSAVRLAP
jgi:hypothetical protein